MKQSLFLLLLTITVGAVSAKADVFEDETMEDWKW
jgi:hypothetical protein